MRKERVTKLGLHAYEMVVRAPAERNLANERVRELLAQEYNVALRCIRIVTGHRSPSKVFTIEDK